MPAGAFFFFAGRVEYGDLLYHGRMVEPQKYSLLGAMRAIAQMISYEVPLILSAVSVIMMTGRSPPLRLWISNRVIPGSCLTGSC